MKTYEHLVQRLPNVEFQNGFGRHWLNGNAFKTQFFNALSMNLPVGEKYFLEAVQLGSAQLPATPEFQNLQDQTSGYVLQEAAHRFIHARYNAVLERQGLKNFCSTWLAQRKDKAQRFKVRHRLAITAAFEHLTAVISYGILTQPSWLKGAETEVRRVWYWHAVEEFEHQSIAFDLYQALDGNLYWRRRWFLYVIFVSMLYINGQLLVNLWHDKQLFKPKTWWQGLRFYFGPKGLLRNICRPLLAYLKADFHPSQFSDHHAHSDWLKEHPADYKVV